MTAGRPPLNVGSGAPLGRSLDTLIDSNDVATTTIFPPGASAVGVGYVELGRSKTGVPPVPNEGSSRPEPKLATATPTPSPATRAHTTQTARTTRRRPTTSSSPLAPRPSTRSVS